MANFSKYRLIIKKNINPLTLELEGISFFYKTTAEDRGLRTLLILLVIAGVKINSNVFSALPRNIYMRILIGQILHWRKLPTGQDKSQ